MKRPLCGCTDTRRADVRLDDLLVRREKTERVTDLVNLDRVRGLLRTIYWRRRFLARRDERRRTLNAEAEGIPAIVLEPTPATPPMDDDPDPFHEADIAPSPSPPASRRSSPSASPELRGTPLRTQFPDLAQGALASWTGGGAVAPGAGFRHSPSLSVSTTPRLSGAAGLSRRGSGASMLSEDDAHRA